MQEVNSRLNSAVGGITYSAAVLFFAVVSLVVSLIISLSGLEQGSDGYLYLSYLISPVAIGGCVTAILFWKKTPFKSVFPVKCNFKYYIIGILLAYGLLFSLGWVNTLSVEFFKLFGYQPRESGSYLPDLSGGYVALALLVIAVLPAFCEELLFRGVLLNACENGMGSIRAVFTVGFCFALFHGSPEQTVYQFIAGCVFAFVAVRSRSVTPSVLMHFINNALIVILGACGLYGEGGEMVISSAANIALNVTSALALAGGLVWLILDKKPLESCRKGGVKSFYLFASVGIAVLALSWFLSLFWVA